MKLIEHELIDSLEFSCEKLFSWLEGVSSGIKSKTFCGKALSFEGLAQSYRSGCLGWKLKGVERDTRKQGAPANTSSTLIFLPFFLSLLLLFLKFLVKVYKANPETAFHDGENIPTTICFSLPSRPSNYWTVSRFGVWLGFRSSVMGIFSVCSFDSHCLREACGGGAMHVFHCVSRGEQNAE